LALLFTADLGIAGQGFASLLVAGVGAALLTLGALWAAMRGGAGPVARTRASRAVLYLLFGAATVAATQFHASTAESHARRVIEACRAFEARYGILPDRLEALVPEFLPAVPRARNTVLWGEFTYSVSEQSSHALTYVAHPPFGRRLYRFEEARWSSLD
jgi:hypothetical protein